jgi:hypothetical protein
MASHGERSYEYFADMSQSNASGAAGSRASSGTWNRSDQVDEAYRRLGTRLSQSAWGDGPHNKPIRLSRLESTQTSCFVSWDKEYQEQTLMFSNDQVGHYEITYLCLVAMQTLTLP